MTLSTTAYYAASNSLHVARLGWAAAALYLATNVAALAQAEAGLAGKVDLFLAHHLSFCEKAFGDPEGYAAALMAEQPQGTVSEAASDDGRVHRVYLGANDGRYTTNFTRYSYAGSAHVNCVSYYSDYGNLGPLDALAEAYTQVMTKEVGANRLQGGKVMAYSTGENSAQLTAYGNTYEFLVDGLFPTYPARTISGLHDGYMSLVTELMQEAQQ